MDENVFKVSLAAIMEGDYTVNDKKAVKEWLNDLSEEEGKIKRQIEKNKREFLKRRDKLTGELSHIKTKIKEIRKILKS